jgi:hypothetical protein
MVLGWQASRVQAPVPSFLEFSLPLRVYITG